MPTVSSLPCVQTFAANATRDRGCIARTGQRVASTVALFAQKYPPGSQTAAHTNAPDATASCWKRTLPEPAARFVLLPWQTVRDASVTTTGIALACREAPYRGPIADPLLLFLPFRLCHRLVDTPTHARVTPLQCGTCPATTRISAWNARCSASGARCAVPRSPAVKR